MEFENITITDQGVVRLKKITIVIPLYNDSEKEIISLFVISINFDLTFL